jgi:hypothetical protein
MEMAPLICVKAAKLKIAQIPLTSNIIHDRIKELSENIRKQEVEQINRGPTKIDFQLHVLNNVSNCAQLLPLDLYVHQN